MKSSIFPALILVLLMIQSLESTSTTYSTILPALKQLAASDKINNVIFLILDGQVYIVDARALAETAHELTSHFPKRLLGSNGRNRKAILKDQVDILVKHGDLLLEELAKVLAKAAKPI